MFSPEADDEAPPTTASRQPAVDWPGVAVVVAVAAAVHLAVATRYGWHPDELYYVICGRHPAWGYVDHPPITPMLAGLAAMLPGGLLPLRLVAIAAQAGCIVFAALLAAEFGGRRIAQTVTAAAVAACPVFVGASLFLGTTVIDQLAWLAVLALVARALRVQTVLSWLIAGAAAGVGLENKYTIAVLLVGVALGLAIWRRDTARSAGPWLAGGVAIVCAVPYLVWNAAHGWPSLRFAGVMSDRMGGPLGSLLHLPLLLLWAGPLLVVLWILGIRWLASPAGRDHRWLLAVAATAVVLFTVTGGRPYYAGPVFAALFAAGAMRVESAATAGLHPGLAATARRISPGWAATLGVSFVGAVLVCLPVLPASTATALRSVNPVPPETYGWPQFVGKVAWVASGLPPGMPIFTSNYGEAAALTILGPAAGLHRPVYSGDNNYALWGPPTESADTVLCVGKFPLTYLHRYWLNVKALATITFPGVQNGESGARVYLCRQPRGSWAAMWPSLRHTWPYL